jgi:hypothetical protein
MTLLEQASKRSSDAALAWVRKADQRLSEQGQSYEASRALEGTAFEHSEMLSHDDLERLLAPETPPLGVFGAGLYRAGDGFLPALFVMSEFIGDPGHRRIEVQRAERGVAAVTLLRRLDLQAPPDAVVVTLPLPSEQASSVHCDMWGTLGIPVTVADGGKGILTAGHVASTLGAAPTVAGVPIGTVAYRNHRRLHRLPELTADVAVIALSEEGLRIAGSAPFDKVGAGTWLGRVRAYGRSATNPGGDLIRSLHERFAVDEFGAWDDVATVDEAISIDGDSGAAVVDEDDAVIGQIVGGHPPTYSLVQNVELLLSDSGTTFRNAS